MGQQAVRGYFREYSLFRITHRGKGRGKGVSINGKREGDRPFYPGYNSCPIGVYLQYRIFYEMRAYSAQSRLRDFSFERFSFERFRTAKYSRCGHDVMPIRQKRGKPGAIPVLCRNCD